MGRPGTTIPLSVGTTELSSVRTTVPSSYADEGSAVRADNGAVVRRGRRNRAPSRRQYFPSRFMLRLEIPASWCHG